MRASFLLVFSLCVPVAAQDEVLLKNGSVLQGKLVAFAPWGFALKADSAESPWKVDWDEVQTLSTQQPLAFLLSNGDRVTGRIVRFEGGRIVLESALLPELSFPPGSLDALPQGPTDGVGEAARLLEAAIAPPAVPPTLTAPPSPDEVKPFLEPKDWSGKVALLGSLREGNISSRHFELRSTFEKQWASDRLKIDALAAYGETEGETTASALLGRVKFDHFFKKDLYLYALAEAEHDEIKDLDLRALLGVGVGLNVWQGEKDHQSLDFEGGLNFIHRDFGSSDEAEQDLAARLFLGYKDRFFDNLKFTQTLELLLPLPDFGEFILRSRTQAELPISEHWTLNNILEVEYQGDPAPGAESLDLKVLVGVTYSF